MTVIKKTYIIELTPEDIELITTALHGQYMTNKAIIEENGDNTVDYIRQNLKAARNLRNEFGNLINRSYMGVDA